LFALDCFEAFDQACCLTKLYYPQFDYTIRDWLPPSNENN